VFTKAYGWIYSETNKFSSHVRSVYISSTLVLSWYLRLGIPRDVLFTLLRPNIFATVWQLIQHAQFFIYINHVTIFDERYKSRNYSLYRVSIKSFPDYKHLLQENYVEYKLFFKCNSTQEVFLQLTEVVVKKYYVF
jgi:hypothetical protein